jgi:hypothetical protein
MLSNSPVSKKNVTNFLRAMPPDPEKNEGRRREEGEAGRIENRKYRGIR